jgi:acyl-CoA thioesterase FadM
MFSITIPIDDEWIAPVYDHVHHGRCLSLLEQARAAFIEKLGFPNEQLLQQGKVIVVTRVDMMYKREVKRGEVQATCDGVEFEDRVLRIRQRLVNNRGKTAVEGVVELMFMDMTTRRGMDVPEDFRQVLLAAKERIAGAQNA